MSSNYRKKKKLTNISIPYNLFIIIHPPLYVILLFLISLGVKFIISYNLIVFIQKDWFK